MSKPLTVEILDDRLAALARQLQAHLDKRFAERDRWLDKRFAESETRIIDGIAKIVEEGFAEADRKWSERHDEHTRRFDRLEARLDQWLPREVSA